ncbi:MAG: hypothetical protein ACE1ZF_02435 [Gemmatimonadales bacterium]
MGCRLADLAKVGEDLVADACTINMHTESVELIATRSPFADERIWCHVNFRLRRRAACSLAVPPAPRRRDRARLAHHGPAVFLDGDLSARTR